MRGAMPEFSSNSYLIINLNGTNINNSSHHIMISDNYNYQVLGDKTNHLKINCQQL